MDQENKIKNIINELKLKFQENVYIDKINQIYFVELTLKNKIIFGQYNNYNKELYNAFNESALTSIEESDNDIILGFQFYI